MVYIEIIFKIISRYQLPINNFYIYHLILALYPMRHKRNRDNLSTLENKKLKLIILICWDFSSGFFTHDHSFNCRTIHIIFKFKISLKLIKPFHTTLFILVRNETVSKKLGPWPKDKTEKIMPIMWVLHSILRNIISKS